MITLTVTERHRVKVSQEQGDVEGTSDFMQMKSWHSLFCTQACLTASPPGMAPPDLPGASFPIVS